MILKSDRGASPETKFWNRVDKYNGPFYQVGKGHPELHGTRCWIWLGYKDKDGYPLFDIKGKHIRAHRFSFELNVRKLIDGENSHHKCENRECTNPIHLEAVTDAEHALRHLPTHCINGHKLTPDNVYVYRRSNGKIFRQCKKCQKFKGNVMRRLYPR